MNTSFAWMKLYIQVQVCCIHEYLHEILQQQEMEPNIPESDSCFSIFLIFALKSGTMLTVFVSCNDAYRFNLLLDQASTLTYFSTCPFGQLTKKSTCPTQAFSCPKKLIKITKTRE